MNDRDILKWALTIKSLSRLRAHLERLRERAAGSDIDDIETLQCATDRIYEFAKANSNEQSLVNMPSETCERLVAAANELSDLAYECFRALVLTREPLVDVMSEWYAKDNFGRSDCARLEALMA